MSAGWVCLQGGGEFSRACRPMDAELVRTVPGPVVVTALAGAPGREYDTATAHGVAHYRAVGAGDVEAAPDVRVDPEAALAALARARLLVLPGGSPARLLDALWGTAVGRLVHELLAGDGLVVGSSAGAMVLGAATVLPDRPGMPVATALGAVPGLAVVPHWTGAASRQDWLRALDEALPAGTEVLGLPEESSVLVRGGVLTALGRSATRLVTSGRDLEPGSSWTPSGKGQA